MDPEKTVRGHHTNDDDDNYNNNNNNNNTTNTANEQDETLATIDAAPNQSESVDESRWRTKSDDEDVLGDVEERKHLFSILDAFRQYRRLAHLNTTHVRRQNLYSLPTAHWQQLAAAPIKILESLNAIDDAIDRNADLAEAILSQGLEDMGLGSAREGSEEPGEAWWHGSASDIDVDKARSTLNQLFRDWSSAGAVERDAVHAPILADLRRHCPVAQLYRGGEAEAATTTTTMTSNKLDDDVHVLVPGAGLGRLVFELAVEGYAAHGNEVSYHQLLASSFVLNHTAQARQFALYPFAASFSNHVDRASQLQRADVPDVHPAGTPLLGTMDMTAGDFAGVYGREEHAGEFDAVATVFFVDTAPDFIEYVLAVANCLKDGGLWTNVGPLLWHFDGNSKRQQQQQQHEDRRRRPRHAPLDHAAAGDEQDDKQTSGSAAFSSSSRQSRRLEPGIGDRGSVELTAEEVMQLLPAYGFEIISYRPSIGDVGYTQNPRSMLKSVYSPCHWAVKKTPSHVTLHHSPSTTQSLK